MMRQDRFTQQAQEVLAASQELVRTQRHSQWDVEHVLLALLQHPDGLAGQVLQKLNVDAGQLRDKVAGTLDKAPKLAYDVVQIYTGLIYRGPQLVDEVARALKRLAQSKRAA